MKVDEATKKDMIAKIGRTLSVHKEIMLAYIYGSFVKGNEFRDLDIALVLGKSMLPYQEAKFCGVIGRELETKVKPRCETDVRIINSAPPHFQFEIVKNGQLVFVRSEDERVRFEEEVLSNYLDYEDTLRWFEERLTAE